MQTILSCIVVASMIMWFPASAKLLLVSQYQNSILSYDETTGAYLGTFVPPGNGGLNLPIDLTFGPDGNLYVASYGSSSIIRYDGRTGAFLSTFVASIPYPSSLRFGPDGNLYVASYSDYNVYRFDGTTGAFKDIFVPAGSGGLVRTWQIRFGP